MIWTSYPFGNFLIGFRASLAIIALGIWFYISIYSYLSIFLDRKISLSITEPLGFIPCIVILSSSIYFFNSPNKWKPYFEEFDKWPKSKNLVGGIIVWSIITLIIVNFIFSVNLMKNLIG